MRLLLKRALGALGIGALFGFGSSAVSGDGVFGGVSDWFNSIILIGLAVFMIWLLFKLIKK